jgi:hypothetical protein
MDEMNASTWSSLIEGEGEGEGGAQALQPFGSPHPRAVVMTVRGRIPPSCIAGVRPRYLDKGVPKMIIDCAHYQDGRRQGEGAVPLEEAAARCGQGGFVWLGLFEPGDEELGPGP